MTAVGQLISSLPVSQSILAERLGVSQQTLTSWKNKDFLPEDKAARLETAVQVLARELSTFTVPDRVVRRKG